MINFVASVVKKQQRIYWWEFSLPLFQWVMFLMLITLEGRQSLFWTISHAPYFHITPKTLLKRAF